jgi:hypothetical protein
MNQIFSGLTTEGLEETEDRLGGYTVYPSAIYNAVIKMAYAGKAASGAHFVTFEFDLGNSQTYRETCYFTNKKGENFWINESKKKVPLPGFTMIDDICLLTTEQPLASQNTEDKMVKVYDSEAKKEVPKSVPVLMDLIGKPISLGILKQLESKNAKNAAGEYVATGETRDTNIIDKAFHTDTKLTVVEARAGKDAGEFWDKWLEKNKDVVRDRRAKTGGASGGAGRPVGGPPVAGGGTERKSLFGAKKAS